MSTKSLLSIALLLGCAGPTPQPTEYLLRDEPSMRARQVPAGGVALSRVAVAAYLDRAGIVVETEGRELQAARQHIWAEPLESGLHSLLRSELSKALGYEVSAGRAPAGHDYVVEIYVDQLHGSMAGSAKIDASYRITSGSAKQSSEFRFSRETALPQKGYPGLVDAEVSLARALARAIADSLQELQQSPSP